MEEVIAPPPPNMDNSSKNSKIAYLVGEDLLNHQELLAALKELNMSYLQLDESSINSNNYIDPTRSIVVFKDFSGHIFDNLRKKPGLRHIIYGIPCIIEAAYSPSKSLPISKSGYPIYNTILSKSKIAVTGLRSKEFMFEIRRFILYMEGTYLEKDSPFLTHLIADKCKGNKYRDAVALGKPILRPEWINFLWERRNDKDFIANSSIDEFKLQTFHGLRIAFEGLSETDVAEMTKLLEANGGILVKSDDPTATHIVRGKPCDNSDFENSLLYNSSSNIAPIIHEDEAEATTKSPMKRARFDVISIAEEKKKEEGFLQSKDYSDRAKIVDVDWFWSSIQLEACADDSNYLIGPNGDITKSFDCSDTPNHSITSPTYILSDNEGTPKSLTPGRRPKRKRTTEDYISSLAQSGQILSPHITTTDSGVPINLGGNSLEQAHSQDISDSLFSGILNRVSVYVDETVKTALKTMTRRQHDFVDLLTTERNYVNILITIIKVFKEPCEADDVRSGRLLNTQEIKTIFGGILPIFSLHRRLLKEFDDILTNWNEENLIGKVFVEYSNELEKCYEKYINFYESVKAEIARCEAEKPRFMAMLKLAQKRPECGRQTLTELMFRPVQRLPSVALILKSLIQHTPKINPDHEWMLRGFSALSDVNKNINEEKRVTDGRVAMFEMFSEIEGCPVDILSSSRTILAKFEVTALCDIIVDGAVRAVKYDQLMICAFADFFLVVKRKGGGPNKLSSAPSVANLTRSPSISRRMIPGASNNQNKHHQQKHTYKFLELNKISNIRRVVDITDLSIPSFALIVRGREEIRERVFAFTVPDDPAWDKTNVLNLFAKNAAIATARVDFGNMIVCADSKSLGLFLSEGSNVLEKAAKFASKTGRKVSRALSLSGRTPNKLKRTFSQMVTSPFSSRNSMSGKDFDSISQSSASSTSTTPLRNHLSSLSLLRFGSKRGTMDPPTTPKTPKAKVTSTSHRGNLNSTFLNCKET